VADLNSSEISWAVASVAKGDGPHLGDVQIACALILSHAGKKPLAQYRVL